MEGVMQEFVLSSGLFIDSFSGNDLVVGLDPQEFQPGFLDSNFEAFTGFMEVDGVVTPVFESVTLTFAGLPS